MTFWREGPEGVTVMVKVQPRSKCPGIQGIGESATGPRLKIAVTEAPEDGKANHAVRTLLAKVLGRPRSMVQVLTGTSNREKLLAVTGDPAELVEKLRRI